MITPKDLREHGLADTEEYNMKIWALLIQGHKDEALRLHGLMSAKQKLQFQDWATELPEINISEYKLLKETFGYDI